MYSRFYAYAYTFCNIFEMCWKYIGTLHWNWYIGILVHWKVAIKRDMLCHILRAVDCFCISDIDRNKFCTMSVYLIKIIKENN